MLYIILDLTGDGIEFIYYIQMYWITFSLPNIYTKRMTSIKTK